MWGAGCCSSELCGKPWTTSCHSAEQLTAHLAQLGQPVALLPKYLRVQQPLQEGLGPTEVLTPWKLKACGSVMMRQSKTRSKGWQKEGIARTIPASCPIHYLPEEMEMCSYHMVGTGGLRWGRGRGEVFEHKEGRQSALAKLLLVFCSVSVFSILEWLQVLRWLTTDQIQEQYAETEMPATATASWSPGNSLL